MIYAEKDGQRVTPKKHEQAICPCCQQKVFAKCGTIKIWHWAHESLADCDDWYEPMTQWHLDWQQQFPENWREIIIRDRYFSTGTIHRADIQLPNGVVIEFQNSPISPQEILKREGFYRKMIWVVNAQNFSIFNHKKANHYEWLWARKAWACAKMPVFLDLGNGYLLWIKGIADEWQYDWHGGKYNLVASSTAKDLFLKKYASSCPANAPAAAPSSTA